MDNREIKAIIESLLFISDEPMSIDRLKEILDGIDRKTINGVIQELKGDYNSPDRGIQLIEIAGGYRIMTRPEYSPWVKKLDKIKLSSKLSRPALETLAIIAYRQPIVKPEIEAVRGVDVGGVLKTLLERRLIKIVGRKDAVGRPIMYGTTKEFLQYFGLRDLSDLPTLKEFKEVAEAPPLPTES